MAIVRMTAEEIASLPPPSNEEIERIKAFKNTDFSDCPPLSRQQLASFHRARDKTPVTAQS